MWILTLEVPVWLCALGVAIAVAAGEYRLHQVRLEQERTRREAAAEHEAAARRLAAWHDGVWRRWQSHVAAHARQYDRYWEEVCGGLLRVYLDHAGDPRLRSLVRGAIAAGTSRRSISHGLAVHYADDPDFVRRFERFAGRPVGERRGV